MLWFAGSHPCSVYLCIYSIIFMFTCLHIYVLFFVVFYKICVFYLPLTLMMQCLNYMHLCPKSSCRNCVCLGGLDCMSSQTFSFYQDLGLTHWVKMRKLTPPSCLHIKYEAAETFLRIKTENSRNQLGGSVEKNPHHVKDFLFTDIIECKPKGQKHF